MTAHMAPFFAALQDLMLDGDPKPQRTLTPARRYPDCYVVHRPQKPIACNACLDTGCTENGGACGWCSREEAQG